MDSCLRRNDGVGAGLTGRVGSVEGMDSRLRGNDEGEEGVNKFPPPTLPLQISSISPLGIAVSI